jgi:hypothetical protein
LLNTGVEVDDVQIRCHAPKEDASEVVFVKLTSTRASLLDADTGAKHYQIQDAGVAAVPTFVQSLASSRVYQPVVKVH